MHVSLCTYIGFFSVVFVLRQSQSHFLYTHVLVMPDNQTLSILCNWNDCND